MPKHVGSWQLLGWTYLLSGDPGKAEKAFEQALELNDKFAETHGSLAAIAALRGDTTQAHRHKDDVALASGAQSLQARLRTTPPELHPVRAP